MEQNGAVEAPALSLATTNLEAKLLELLHRLNSPEIKLVSDAAKEFIKLLKSETTGAELLRIYAFKSPGLSELGTAWKLREGKTGASYVLKLIAAVLGHPGGKFEREKGRVTVSRVLDRFAKGILEGRLDAVYKELGSKDAKRQNAALLLMASVVKRGAGMASEVEKRFNFKLAGFAALGAVDRRRKQKRSTRKAFVRFALSFLEEGKPWLIRRVLKQREMFSVVLRGLGESREGDDGEDEEEIIVHVLSTLRDKVLIEESTVPPGLRSVLFGSVTLERLIGISGRENGSVASELAHGVLVLVCTDPRNGLMPDLRRQLGPLKGNPKRLLDLMNKLRAAEVGNHRDLALAIIRGRPEFGSAYLENFPYNVEDYASHAWFGAISLAAEVVSTVGKDNPFGFLDPMSNDPPSFDSVEVQAVLKCISPRPLGRSVINKGLLHSDFLVKNGTLRFLLEVLKLLESFSRAINPDCSTKQLAERWQFLRQEIFNEMRTLLPDPQVLLTLLSSFTNQIASQESHLKRKAEEEILPDSQHVDLRRKKSRVDADHDDSDIIIAGIDSSADVSAAQDDENGMNEHLNDEMSAQKDFASVISELWGSNLHLEAATSVKEAELFFLSKLLEALKFFLMTMPDALKGSFEFLMSHLSSGVALSSNHQVSLMSLLAQFIKWCPRSGKPVGTPALMYKHTQVFLNLLILSPVDKIKIEANNMAQAAMSSTGAFDRNPLEVVAWIKFLPGYASADSSIDLKQIDVLRSFSPFVISFLCDAVSTIGNNLFKYWDVLKKYMEETKETNDALPYFSPLVICVLQKCMRLLISSSGTFSLPEKVMISVYVSNTLKYLLQTQVNASLLSVVIRSVVSKGLPNDIAHSADSLCEWRPLKNLLSFAKNILYHEFSYASSMDLKVVPPDTSFKIMLDKARVVLDSNCHSEVPQVRKAFLSAIMCTTVEVLLQNFPSVVTIAWCLRVPASFLSSVAFLEQGFLSGFLKLWPNIFWSSVDMAICGTNLRFTSIKDVNWDVDSPDGNSSAAAAFSLVLRKTPFHMLLSAIVGLNIADLSNFSKLNDFLVAKLSAYRTGDATSYLCLILFWLHQLQSCICIHPSDTLKQLAETCCVIVKKILSQLSVVKSDSEDAGGPVSVENVVEVAETIFGHPSVTKTLTNPSTFNMGSMKEHLDGDLEAFITFSAQSVYSVDLHVLDILRTTCDCLTSTSSGQNFMLKYGGRKLLLKAYHSLLVKLSVQLKEKFDHCIRTEDIFPLLQSFYAFHSLVQFISPFQLLELGHWMFKMLNVNVLISHKPYGIAALSVGFCVVSDAFRSLPANLQHQETKVGILWDLWEVEERNFDVKFMEEIYLQVCKLAADSNLDGAYDCLLNVIEAVYVHIYRQPGNLHPISCALLQMIASTPLKILPCCIYQTSKKKAKLLNLLVEMSFLHLSEVGHILTRIIEGSSCVDGGRMARNTSLSAPWDEEFMLLLPAALSYLKSISGKLDKERFAACAIVTSFYSKLLIANFHDWNSFVDRHAFWDSYDGCLSSTTEELITLTDNSCLGRAVDMLQEHFSLEGDMNRKKRLKLCSSLLSCSFTTDLLDYDGSTTELRLLRNRVIRVVAKVKLCRMLLLQKGNKIVSREKEVNENSKEEIYPELKSNKEGQLTMKFLKDLVGCWHLIVKEYPSIIDASAGSQTFHHVKICRILELFILKSVLEVVTDLREVLTQLQAIPFLEQLVRFSLLYRFEDPKTLRTIRLILTVLMEGNVGYTQYLRLLLSHSQFAPTMQSSSVVSGTHTGVLSAPVSSILRFPAFPRSSKNNNFQLNEKNLRKLEIVKLLRVLLCSSSRQIECNPENDGINLKELHTLLLSSYGATTSEIDLEICNVMHEIESTNKSIIEEVTEMDFLWGPAALTIRKDQVISKNTLDALPGKEVIDEHRKSVFRDNFPVDPNTCYLTVLHFPYDRTFLRDLSADGITLTNLVDHCEAYDHVVDNVQPYDPLFILRFSIHALSQCYIEPVEFSAMGLLAIAIISVSSPDIGVRKLGYEFIGRYKQASENSQKNKDITRLRLLLTYIQNGIEEPWQKVPSIVALFAAESSIILLDPSHEHHSAISKHFIHSSRMNMKGIPLFDTFFQSSSVNFRTERLWILRLAYAGMNLEDDAQIFVRNSTMETLLSFYASSLSDPESRDLILQILKKSVRLHKSARHLVEKCGLFPWVSSVVSSYRASLNDNIRVFGSRQLIALMEVVMDAISSTDIFEWLQNHSLEQLMDLTSHLYKLLVCDVDVSKENVTLVDLLLQIMVSTLKLSQRRKIYQPRLTLSFDGFFRIYQRFSLSDVPTTLSAEAGLNVILMSPPSLDIFHLDQGKLLPFLQWTVSTALKSNFRNLSEYKAPSGIRKILCDDASYEESLVSKTMRWLVASTLVAKLSIKLGKLRGEVSKGSRTNKLQSFLEFVQEECQESNIDSLDCEQALAETLLHLLQLLGMNFCALPSVVSVLCILLLCGSLKNSDIVINYKTKLETICSEIRSPVEANPAWRWSFYQEPENLSSELSDSQKLAEQHACQKLIVITSNILRKKSQNSQLLSLEEIEHAGVFEWEQNIIDDRS